MPQTGSEEEEEEEEEGGLVSGLSPNICRLMFASTNKLRNQII